MCCGSISLPIALNPFPCFRCEISLFFILYKLFLINTLFFFSMYFVKLSCLLSLDLDFSGFVFFLVLPVVYFFVQELEPAIIFSLRSSSFYKCEITEFILQEKLVSCLEKQPMCGHHWCLNELLLVSGIMLFVGSSLLICQGLVYESSNHTLTVRAIVSFF